jgi:hypothetical protein
MAPDSTKAAQHGDAGDLRNVQSGRADTSEHRQADSWPQDRIIAHVDKHRRAQFEIALHTYQAGIRCVDLRLRERDGFGVFRSGGPRIALAPNKLRSIIEGLEQAERVCIAEGLL